jgi:hypothetical protein
MYTLSCKVKQSRYTPWRRLGGGERRNSSYSFLTSALDGGEWSASRPGRAFTPGERTPGTHCTGGWVDRRAGLDTEARGKILCLRRGSNPDHPVVQPVVRHYTAWANPAPTPSCTYLFIQVSAYMPCTERRGWVINIPASCSGGPDFKSRSENRLSWLNYFLVFLIPSRRMLGVR